MRQKSFSNEIRNSIHLQWGECFIASSFWLTLYFSDIIYRNETFIPIYHFFQVSIRSFCIISISSWNALKRLEIIELPKKFSDYTSAWYEENCAQFSKACGSSVENWNMGKHWQKTYIFYTQNFPSTIWIIL